jgi:hypothetical protein
MIVLSIVRNTAFDLLFGMNVWLADHARRIFICKRFNTFLVIHGQRYGYLFQFHRVGIIVDGELGFGEVSDEAEVALWTGILGEFLYDSRKSP